MKLLASVVIVVVLGVIGWAIYDRYFGPCEGADCPPTTSTKRVDAVTISMASSLTKTEWLNNAAATFNEAAESDARYQVDGKPVFVEILVENDPLSGKPRHWNSPTQVQATLDGKIEPTILSPATLTWIQRLNKQWGLTQGGVLSSDPNPRSLLSTPVVIAMWEDRARALDCWPTAGPECTWSTIREMATDDRGWGAVGQPGWGKFKFGYAYVGESDVGTQTAALICMAAIDKRVDVQVNDFQPENECGQGLEDVERAINHRGTSSPLILEAMLLGGPSFLDAVTTYEKNVIGFNTANPDSPWGRLVSVYPSDGTVIADHVFAIMDKATWVSDEQLQGARLFENFLLSDEQQRLVSDTGLRPSDGTVPPGSVISTNFGANPAANYETIDVPHVDVIEQVTDVWKLVKKPAIVVLVFDKSASMAGEKLGAAIQGSVRFVEELNGNDWLAWLPFDDDVHAPTTGTVSDIGEQLKTQIRGTPADGATALYEAVAEALNIVIERRAQQGDSARYGIVVLSDGRNNGPGTLPSLEALLRDSTREGEIGIEVHTVGVGKDVIDSELSTIARATDGGRYWKVEDAQTLEEVYKRISKYW